MEVTNWRVIANKLNRKGWKEYCPCPNCRVYKKQSKFSIFTCRLFYNEWGYVVFSRDKR